MKKTQLRVWNKDIWEDVFPVTDASLVKYDFDGEEVDVANALNALIKPDGDNLIFTETNGLKVNPVYLPDAILGQLIFGGVIDYGFKESNPNGFWHIAYSPFEELKNTFLTNHLYDDSLDLTGYYFIYAGETIPAEELTFDFVGSASLVAGDWLLVVGKNTSGNGDPWILTKVDNTDAVTGVKGAKESVYRFGNVNLTPANIGALSKITIGTVTTGEETSITATTNNDGTETTLNFVLEKSNNSSIIIWRVNDSNEVGTTNTFLKFVWDSYASVSFEDAQVDQLVITKNGKIWKITAKNETDQNITIERIIDPMAATINLSTSTTVTSGTLTSEQRNTLTSDLKNSRFMVQYTNTGRQYIFNLACRVGTTLVYSSVSMLEDSTTHIVKELKVNYSNGSWKLSEYSTKKLYMHIVGTKNSMDASCYFQYIDDNPDPTYDDIVDYVVSHTEDEVTHTGRNISLLPAYGMFMSGNQKVDVKGVGYNNYSGSNDIWFIGMGFGDYGDIDEYRLHKTLVSTNYEIRSYPL